MIFVMYIIAIRRNGIFFGITFIVYWLNYIQSQCPIQSVAPTKIIPDRNFIGFISNRGNKQMVSFTYCPEFIIGFTTTVAAYPTVLAI